MRPIELLNRLRIRKHPQAGWQPYVWLCYLGFLFIPLTWPGSGHSWILPTILTIPVFLVFYFRCFSPWPHWKLGNVLAIALLGLALAPFNPLAWTYIVYAVSIAPSAVRGAARVAMLTVALLGVYTLEILWLGQPQALLSLGIAVLACAVSVLATLTFIARARQDAAIRLSQEEIRRLATVAERERIGRDLHDLLGHTLSLIALKSELAGKLLDRDPDAARREIAEVTHVAREALRQVRAAVTGMRAAALDAELASARALLQSSGVSVTIDRGAVTLAPAIETALALIVREATTNIHRHSEARHATIEIGTAGSGGERCVCLSVRDDGRGGASERGTGLTGIRERVRSLGGSFTIDSPRGRGTVLQARLPTDAAADEVTATRPDTVEPQRVSLERETAPP
jgi:two-component system sensor histidine kinase DesK